MTQAVGEVQSSRAEAANGLQLADHAGHVISSIQEGAKRVVGAVERVSKDLR